MEWKYSTNVIDLRQSEYTHTHTHTHTYVHTYIYIYIYIYILYTFYSSRIKSEKWIQWEITELLCYCYQHIAMINTSYQSTNIILLEPWQMLCLNAIKILLTCFIESGIPFNIHILLIGISNYIALQQDINFTKKYDTMNQASLWRQPISNVEWNITSMIMLSAPLWIYKNIIHVYVIVAEDILLIQKGFLFMMFLILILKYLTSYATSTVLKLYL